MTRAVAIAAFVACAAAPVHAEPVHACAVRVVRAPAEIRAEIEHWLAGESSCNVALEVRVVPTEGGYYLLARDVRGRVRERLVPDGASAGVLVASWASDDQLGADEPAPNVPRPAALDGDDDDDDEGSGAIQAAGPAIERIAPPSASPVIAARASTPAPVPASSKWLRLDLIGSVAGVAGTGLHAEVDVWQRRGWSVGLAASFANGAQLVTDAMAFDGTAPLLLRDIDALAYVARAVDVVSWLHVRGSLAAGARVRTATLAFVDEGEGVVQGPSSATGVLALADASLLAAAELGHGWAIELGVLVTAVPPMHASLQTTLDPDASELDLNAAVGVQLFGGLAHKL